MPNTSVLASARNFHLTRQTRLQSPDKPVATCVEAQVGALDVTNATESNQLAGKKFCPQEHHDLYKIIPHTVDLCYKATGILAYACFF